MAKLIVNSIIKFTAFSLLLSAIEPSWCGVLLATNENDADHGHTESHDYFKMINDFEHVTQREDPVRSGAFTFSSDRRSVVECGGTYKRLQSEIRSPGFPEGTPYQGNLHCEYTFKSPFVCSSQYHFQFLEFDLEPSRNCSKDRLAIGDDEILCGTVIGSKLYGAPGGLLRMKFVTDGWGTGRGFRILVTRQPCVDDNEAAESSTAYTVFTTIQVADGTESSAEDVTTVVPVAVSGDDRIVSSRQDIPPEFNPGGNGYLPPTTVLPVTPYPPTQTFPCQATPCPYPSWGCSAPNYPFIPVLPPRPPCDPRYQSCGPTYPTYPTYPSYPQQPVPIPPRNPTCPQTPCGPGQPVPQYPQYPSYYPPGYPGTTSGTEGTTSLGGPPPGYEPVKSEVKPEFPEPTTERVTDTVEPQNQVAFVPGLGPPCCRNAFNQRRFYLSSANFPSQTTVNRDCVVHVQRHSPYTCRLVIAFKFFALGNDQYPGCPGGFVEIDGRRICGCRTGQIYHTADFGPNPTKMMRIHTQAGRFPTVQGFILDVYQEDCPQRFPLKRSDGYQIPRNGYSYEMSRVEGRELSIPVHTFRTTNTTTTHQTTRQYYVYNMDEAKPVIRPEDPQKFVQIPTLQASGGNRCLFTTLDWLRLKLDMLWIFKPVCLA